MRTKVAFVWDFSVSPVELHTWADGLNAALGVLQRDYEYDIYVIADDKQDSIHKKIRDIKPDVILGWGSLDRPSFAGVKEHGVPTALCFAGGPTNHFHTSSFDIIFVENEVYEQQFKKQSINVKRAFGTNSELFVPIDVKVHFKAFYPAAFALWKRHELFAKAVGTGGIACGKFIEQEKVCIEVCVENGVTILPPLPYAALPYLYNQSEFTLITATTKGGSQRAVLEAMSCNRIPIVMSDSEKCAEYVKDSGFGVIVEPTVEAIKEALSKTYKFDNDGRSYILSKYSADIYAKQLHEGIQSIL